MPLLLASAHSAMSAQVKPIEVGVLNNLSDAGLKRGEMQIIELFAAVAGERLVRLSFFSLPSIKRSSVAQSHIAKNYKPYSQLGQSHLDGLIVTGCEPRNEMLPQESFWRELTAVIDWAEHNTRSTIWSCLAAHAAVLHLDGIKRRRLANKCTGLFSVEMVSSHPLLANASSDLRVSHSRWNALDPIELEAAGYQILTKGKVVGADTFMKKWRSLFVYLQGHPEYDADALAREYRRDVNRYLVDAGSYPKLPQGYFDPTTEAALAAFQAQASAAPRDPTFAATIPTGRRHPSAWPRHYAHVLFSNWLTYVGSSTVRSTVIA